MRAWTLTGSPRDWLRLEERPDPALAPTQVRVELRAASLNYRDLLVGESPPRPGLVPVSDGAGEVIEVGSAVRDLEVGDRVVGAFFAAWPSGAERHANVASALGGDLDGVLSERVVLDAAAAAEIPDDLSFAEAATFPCAGVTAWHALIAHAFPLEARDTVLTLGTGGVSMFALQIAKLRGARVVATSTSPMKLGRLHELGADVVIDTTAIPAWHEAAREATGGRGVDFIIETVGAETLERSLRACAVGGCVTLVGLLSGRAASADAETIRRADLTLRSIYVGPMTMLRESLEAFATARVRPIIDRSFAFDDALAAFDHLRSGRHFGKVLIER